MTFYTRIDPDSRAALAAVTTLMPDDLWAPDPAVRRAAGEAMLAAMPPAPPHPAVQWIDRMIPGQPGHPDIPVRVYRPSAGSGPHPAVLVIHGGGMWGGSLASEHPQATALCAALEAVVISVGYRLAPEHPHPAPVTDCYGALCWLAAHAADLGADPQRLAVYGGSAGGGLALGTALRARDHGGPTLALVMALYPMIDPRHDTPSSREFENLGPIWDRGKNIEAWGWYLAGQEADPYAAPVHATSLHGLPPVFIDVGELDLFRDEDIAFAQRLMAAGVPAELHVYPGAFHASEHLAPDAALSRRIVNTRMTALRRALRVQAAPPQELSPEVVS